MAEQQEGITGSLRIICWTVVSVNCGTAHNSSPAAPCSWRSRKSPVTVSGMEDFPNAKRGTAATAAADLPDELILKILSRVPARSIHRFKCVSKAWRDLITDPVHQEQLPQTLEGFFCGHRLDLEHGRFISLPGKSAPLVDPGFSFLTKQPELDNIELLGSCNGLILFEFEHCSDPTSRMASYAVCNPATEQWVVVPSTGLPSGVHSRTYLSFDPAASPHFHLVHVQEQFLRPPVFKVCIYSSETRGWKDRFLNVGGTLGTRSGCSAFVNGMLHFVISDWQKNVNLIVAVDKEGEARIIQSPGGNNGHPALFLAQPLGRLHCIRRHTGEACLMTEDGLSIWVLEDYDAGHWVLKHSVKFSDLSGQPSHQFSLNYSAVSIHPDCDIFFFVESWYDRDQGWKLISYDMHSKEVHVLHDIGYYYCPLIPYVPYLSKSLVFANKH